MFAAYLVFITMRGELPKYAGLLLLSPGDKGGSGLAVTGDPSANVASTSHDQGANIAKAAQVAMLFI